MTAIANEIRELMDRAAAMPAASREDAELEAERQLLADLERRYLELGEAPVAAETIEAYATKEREATELYREMGEAREKVMELMREAKRKREELKHLADRAERWRMYQVWRIIDADGYTDWTPGGPHRESYAIKEVGQVINFKANNDILNMCRSGTHMARFIYDAIRSHIGDRAVRLELEGWVDHNSYFQCEQAKVLAIIPLNALMGLPEPAAYTEDIRLQALLRYYEPGSAVYIDPAGASTSRADTWREYFLHLFRLIVDKIEADENYQPSRDELVPLLLVAEHAELNNAMFNITLRSLVGEGELRNYFEHAVRHSLERRAAVAVQGRHTGMSNAQQKMLTISKRELEVQVRNWVKENLPGVVIKDFGVSRGRDPLDPQATSSPKYWLAD